MTHCFWKPKLVYFWLYSANHVILHWSDNTSSSRWFFFDRANMVVIIWLNSIWRIKILFLVKLFRGRQNAKLDCFDIVRQRQEPSRQGRDAIHIPHSFSCSHSVSLPCFSHNVEDESFRTGNKQRWLCMYSTDWCHTWKFYSFIVQVFILILIYLGDRSVAN